ncbi:3-mercaptopyruvate sulfurtransferase [Sneathiella sp. HT1-7]|jgi:thiosulfate/3-mercaptopyruvate sulfurtransferase|uniref:3-mercaptopyruvate sulfurtransferase n=1 Tax=Sneathiella sp. HT1-7 TaxID=2887192 RepID=UPI001D145911|nr:3-mercaptopyruvate sulfurtransferase [Sneathiella sp. HT1-7]MCC3304911.1 3-mercaptopyruvate sulfurtransferase [Sneathiella sp. HT1-7]
MSYVNSSSLVSTEWLTEHAAAPDVRIVDASWHMPATGRNPRAEYDAEHIPGAVFFDIDEIADTDNPLPHMVPSPEKFSSRMRKLGLGDGNRIVVYDTIGNVSAARAWWLLRLFGHQDVAILDGGLPKWKAEGRPVDDMPVKPAERHFTSRINSFLLREKDQVARNINQGREQVLDARSAGRFEGTEPEPREGLRSGHIPGAKNLPFTNLLKDGDGTFRPAAELSASFESAGVDLKKPVITSCGSGITACVLAFGLHLLGHQRVAVFDGSWTEWALDEELPVETGK